MPSVEYKCSQCSEVFWHELDYDEPIPASLRHYCHAVKGYWTMMRRDQAPTTPTTSTTEDQ